MEKRNTVNAQEFLEKCKRINELYYQSLLEYRNELELAQSTKAWKIMCLLRRVNEQYFKGNAVERKKFLKWVYLKLFSKPIPKELALSVFSPIRPINIKQYNLPEYEINHSNIIFSENRGLINYPKKIDVFRFPVIEWEFRWQRPQQISVEFQKNGHRVFYFSIETNSIRNKNATFEEIAQNTIVKELQDNIFWVKLCSYEALNAYKDTIEGLNLEYILLSIKSLKQKFNIGATYSIIDLPFWSDVAFSLKNNKVIYDCMDDHEGFSTNSSKMLTKESMLIQKADIVIASSQRLYEKISCKNSNTLLVRNAGDYEHFSKNPNLEPEELANIKGPIIGYYGAISEWFDINLIEELAMRNKNWNFLLIGNTFGCDISRAEKLDNIFFTGEVPYQNLPKYLYKFDVCIIPFKVNNLTLATNPVKVYEYLASGKPIVSTRLPELEYMNDLVYLADNLDCFEININKSLNESNNDIILKRKEFAANNTWQARYNEINYYLNKDCPKVSIVIVTYNNWSYTKQCLDSLFINNEYPNTEIILIDNNSMDETRVELAKIKHPNLKVFYSSENLGFAGGNKVGCNLATGEYIILLNNDTIVTPGWIEGLIKHLKENNELGMVGPVSNSVGNDQMLDFFIGDSIYGPSLEWLEDYRLFNKGKIRYTDLLGFFCVAIKREVYEKAGDLDTNYGIGMFEDDDYCEKVKSLGYKLGIVEDVFIYHHGSVSFKKLESEQYRSIWEKNKKYFESKWNKKWKMPKLPKSLFLNITDSREVAKIVKSHHDLTPILVVGDWKNDSIYCKEMVSNLTKNVDNLIFVLTEKFNGEEYHGLRRLADNLYFTNKQDILTEIQFEKVIVLADNYSINKIKMNEIVKKDQLKDHILV